MSANVVKGMMLFRDCICILKESIILKYQIILNLHYVKPGKILIVQLLHITIRRISKVSQT